MALRSNSLQQAQYTSLVKPTANAPSGSLSTSGAIVPTGVAKDYTSQASPIHTEVKQVNNYTAPAPMTFSPYAGADTGDVPNSNIVAVNPVTDVSSDDVVPSDTLAEFNSTLASLDHYTLTGSFEQRRSVIIGRWNEAVANKVDSTAFSAIVAELQSLLSDVTSMLSDGTPDDTSHASPSSGGGSSIVMLALIGAAVWYFAR